LEGLKAKGKDTLRGHAGILELLTIGKEISGILTNLYFFYLYSSNLKTKSYE